MSFAEVVIVLVSYLSIAPVLLAVGWILWQARVYRRRKRALTGALRRPAFGLNAATEASVAASPGKDPAVPARSRPGSIAPGDYAGAMFEYTIDVRTGARRQKVRNQGGFAVAESRFSHREGSSFTIHRVLFLN